jgi:hypothetical protein
MHKRGVMSFLLIFLVIFLLFFSILMLAGGIIVTRINTAFDQDIDIGQVNLQDVNADTIGQFSAMFLNNADWWGISVIFGTILGIFLSAYFLRGKLPRWALILEIFIIFVMFIISLYVGSTYQTLINSLAETGETFLEDYTPKTSLFILNLHIYVVIIGVLSMILFHSSLPKKRGEEVYQSGGYLQGAY